MEQRANNYEQLLKLSKAALSVLGAYLVWEIAFGAADGVARDKVKERANGKCERCQRPLDEVPPDWHENHNGEAKNIVGHLNHKYDDRYNDPENLRHHCRFCETVHHAEHIGKAELIGLTEEDNLSTALSWLVVVIRAYPRRVFMNFYRENKQVIDALLATKNKNLDAFVAKHANWRR